MRVPVVPRCLLTAFAIVVLATGCQPAPAAAPTVAPTAIPPTAVPPTAVPPTDIPPPPTAAPASAMKLGDLTGWWVNTYYPLIMVHHDADGRLYRFWDFGNTGQYLLSGTLDYDLLSIVDGTVTIYAYNYMMPNRCPRAPGGRYTFALSSPDTLTWSMVEDSCRARQSAVDSVPYTRARSVEALIGVWVGGAQGQYRFTFRDDVQYRLEDVSGAEPKTVVFGAFRWDPNAQQLLLRDSVDSPCLGPGQPGYYRAAVEGAKTLTLEAVDDPCEARKQAVGAFGPYTRSQEPPKLVGCYASRGTEGFTLCFTAAGLYRLHTPQDEALNETGDFLPHEGEYLGDGSKLRLIKLRSMLVDGKVPCRGDVGDYEFQLAGDALTVAVGSDPCGERKLLFEGNPTWMRVKE